MIYSKNLREFYSTYFMDKILLPGKYRLKFIVDSIWTCDGNLPIGEDDKGNYNNIIKITSNDVKQGKKAESRDIKLIKNKVF